MRKIEKRSVFCLILAALLGIGMLVAGGNWLKFGVVLIVFGAFLAWWSKNLHLSLIHI